MQIHLRNLRLYAYHGLHSAEAVLGNDYEVNLLVNYTSPHTITHIDQTVNYAELCQVVKDTMAIRKNLLETVAIAITSEIIAKFPLVETVEISIYKLHPPIEQFQGSVGVTHKVSR